MAWINYCRRGNQSYILRCGDANAEISQITYVAKYKKIYYWRGSKTNRWPNWGCDFL